jgi:hypothetical protein
MKHPAYAYGPPKPVSLLMIDKIRLGAPESYWNYFPQFLNMLKNKDDRLQAPQK